MNPKCPECQTELPEDFGIVTCTNCGAVCSVDLDGNAEVQGEIEVNASSDELSDDNANFDDGLEDSSETESFDDSDDYQPMEGSSYDGESDFYSEEEDGSSDFEGGADDDNETDNLESPEFDSTLQDEGDELFEASEGDDESEYEEDQLDGTAEVTAFDDDSADMDSDGYDQDDLDSNLEMSSLDEDSNEQIESADEDLLEEGDEEDSSQLSEPLSSEGFFKNLELFTEQLDPQDHHHTYYKLKVSGFETNSDLDEVLDLTLDDRLGIIKEGLDFDETNQSFIIPKVSFLRLVTLHKRLSTLSFIDMEWSLTEDQSDIVDEVQPEGYEDEEATEVGDQMADPGDDDTLYEEVDESDY